MGRQAAAGMQHVGTPTSSAHRYITYSIPRARRYISVDFSGSALHPIDVLDAGSGRQLAQLVDANLVRALQPTLRQGLA